jgi:hypothetical protein
MDKEQYINQIIESYYEQYGTISDSEIEQIYIDEFETPPTQEELRSLKNTADNIKVNRYLEVV